MTNEIISKINSVHAEIIDLVKKHHEERTEYMREIIVLKKSISQYEESIYKRVDEKLETIKKQTAHKWVESALSWVLTVVAIIILAVSLKYLFFTFQF